VCRSPYLVTFRNEETGVAVIGLAAPDGLGIYTGTPQSLSRMTDAGCACRRERCVHAAAMALLTQQGVFPEPDPWAEGFEVVYADAGGVTARISWDAPEGPFSAMIEVRNGYPSVVLSSPAGGLPPRRTGLVLKDGRFACTCGVAGCLHHELYLRARSLGWEPLTYDRAAAEAAVLAMIEQRTALTNGQSEYVLDRESIRIMRAPDGRRTWLAAIAMDRKNSVKGLMLEVESHNDNPDAARVSAVGTPPLLKKRIGVEASRLARRGYREVWW
jgi:hypothetical protein